MRQCRRGSALGMRVIGWIAVADLAAGDGEEVLHHEAEPSKRAAGASGERLSQSMRNEGVNGVLGWNGDHVHVVLLWSVERDYPLYHRPDCAVL